MRATANQQGHQIPVDKKGFKRLPRNCTMAGKKITLDDVPVTSILSRTQENNFCRLSPFAFLARMFGALILILFVFVVVIAAAFLFYSAGFPWFIPTALVLVGLLSFSDVAYSWWYISSFIFSLEGQYLFVRKGVIAHSYTIIPYENVQDIHVVQSLSDRIFGVWSVIIFTATATSAGSDNIFGLEKENAERLKEAVFAKMKEAKHVTD